MKHYILFVFIYLSLSISTVAMDNDVTKSRKFVPEFQQQVVILILNTRQYPDGSFSLFTQQPKDFLSSPNLQKKDGRLLCFLKISSEKNN